MSEAIKSLRSFLTKSPSVVYPEDVLAYLPAIEAENTKLRELVHGLDHCITWASEDGKDCWSCPLWHEKDCTAEDIERELGIEENEVEE